MTRAAQTVVDTASAQCDGDRLGSRDGWWKLATVLLVLVQLRLPVTHLRDFLLLATSVLVVVCVAPERRPTRRLLALVIALLSAGLQLALPALRIQEGHNAFFVTAPGQPLQKGLPPAVFHYMYSAFQHLYPPAQRCTAAQPSCWTTLHVAPAHLYAFSSTSVLHPAKYSRVVDGIDFDSRETLQLEMLNENDRYNFYDALPYNFKRARIPYFVMYLLPASVVGGRLCWRGNVFFESPDGQYHRRHSAETACRRLTSADVGRRVYGVEVDPRQPLAMHLHPPAGLAWFERLAAAVSIIGVLLSVWMATRITSWRELALPLGAVAATMIWARLVQPSALSGFTLLGGGGDGLGYEGFALRAVQHAMAGDWRDALRAGDSIFYSMPGLRYFLALAKPLFGDTFFGYLLVAMLLPVTIWRLLREFVSPRASAILVGLFLLTPLFENLRFTQLIYVKLVVQANLAETLGYTAFLGALALALPFAAGKRRLGSTGSALVGLLCFVAVAARPNIAQSAGLLLAFIAYLQWRAGQRRDLVALVLGFAPTSLMALHNYWFGGRFYLFTDTATNPANLEMPPSVYLAALRELLSLHLHGVAVHRVVQHLANWNSAGESYRLLVVAVTVHVAFSRRYQTALRLLAWLALSQQALLFFYHGSGRYDYLAWLLCFLVFVVVYVQRWWPAWQRWRARPPVPA